MLLRGFVGPSASFFSVSFKGMKSSQCASIVKHCLPRAQSNGTKISKTEPKATFSLSVDDLLFIVTC